jgi:hypothetical protein
VVRTRARHSPSPLRQTRQGPPPRQIVWPRRTMQFSVRGPIADPTIRKTLPRPRPPDTWPLSRSTKGFVLRLCARIWGLSVFLRRALTVGKFGTDLMLRLHIRDPLGAGVPRPGQTAPPAERAITRTLFYSVNRGSPIPTPPGDTASARAQDLRQLRTWLAAVFHQRLRNGCSDRFPPTPRPHLIPRGQRNPPASGHFSHPPLALPGAVKKSPEGGGRKVTLLSERVDRASPGQGLAPMWQSYRERLLSDGNDHRPPLALACRLAAAGPRNADQSPSRIPPQPASARGCAVSRAVEIDLVDAALVFTWQTHIMCAPAFKLCPSVNSPDRRRRGETHWYDCVGRDG